MYVNLAIKILVLNPFLSNSLILSGLVRAYLALSKSKEALFTAREAMKAMQQSAKALKLVGDVHAVNATGREKVSFVLLEKNVTCESLIWD